MSQPELEKKKHCIQSYLESFWIFKNFKYPILSLVSGNPVKIYPSLINVPAT